jgi:ribonuclease HI
MLMFIDGACSNNGQVGARGGCGVVFTSIHEAKPITFPLENDGTPHTSNRAELRAALVALGLRVWNGEGFNNVILACDSEYVVLGASQRLDRWVRTGWVTRNGTPVKNRDLWEALLEEMRKQESYGVHVQFWLIPREWNEADQYAKKATVGFPTLFI